MSKKALTEEYLRALTVHFKENQERVELCLQFCNGFTNEQLKKMGSLRELLEEASNQIKALEAQVFCATYEEPKAKQ